MANVKVINMQGAAVRENTLSDEEFKTFLRKSVYDMPLPESFTLRSELWKK